MLGPGMFVFSIVGLVGGPIWFLHGFQAFRRKRLIENTPTAKIRSMAMGLVEVNGRVTSRSAVNAPFSGRSCAFWEVDIAIRSGKDGWRTVHRNASGHPFFIEDETGAALVFPHGAECRIQFQVQEECLGISLPDCYADYLKEHAPAHGALWRLGTLRFRERCLEDNQHTYVIGTAVPKANVLVVSDGEAMAATGTDGFWNPRQRQLDRSVIATIRQGTNEPTFIISQSSELELTFSLAAKAFVGMVGGPLASVASLGYLLLVLASRTGH